jgi:hypothetical protein
MMRPNLRARIPSINGRHMLNKALRSVRVPLLPGHLVQGAVADDAGVIHQHLDRSDRGLDRPDTGDASVEITGVPLVRRHTSSRSEYPGCGFIAGIGSRYLVTGFK